jgi:hypothetical protein
MKKPRRKGRGFKEGSDRIQERLSEGKLKEGQRENSDPIQRGFKKTEKIRSCQIA